MVLLACSCNDCGEDQQFTRLFEESFDTIVQFMETERGVDEISETELNQAMFFVGKIMGHMDQRTAGHFGIIYHYPDQYKKDKEVWESWYKQHKCTFTMAKADSIFQTLHFSIKSKHKNWNEYLDSVD